MVKKMKTLINKAELEMGMMRFGKIIRNVLIVFFIATLTSVHRKRPLFSNEKGLFAC